MNRLEPGTAVCLLATSLLGGFAADGFSDTVGGLLKAKSCDVALSSWVVSLALVCSKWMVWCSVPPSLWVVSTDVACVVCDWGAMTAGDESARDVDSATCFVVGPAVNSGLGATACKYQPQND